ncbi:heme peroxidase [Gloeophyllum trabeum ATCC 11539]|uniref:Peroxidase n=1 Tax=Gloeophyllum trabeum (strain ATCC 11539 / FP-39264 / Madison 617) TaxID=670483 RepID=S7QAU9_GLOTA|nr:heme peroxidase [Gloeophyllum trabeum ATCC 11539]EPQ57021.1 heme peroxidase [Gloeophyllum trabeum ATCC 11539]
MSFSLFRAPVCKGAFSAVSAPRSAARIQFRKYASGPSGSSESKTGFWAAIGAGVTIAGGLAYYMTTSNSDTARQAQTAAKSGAQAVKAATNFTPSKDDFQKVYNRIAEVMDEAGDYDDGSYGPIFVRLAWHCSGTYDKASNTGGSNFATMRFEPESLHGGNKGLHIAREVMEGIKKDFPWISYGDLWTLGGVAAIQEMQGPKIPWRPGRIDGFQTDCTPDGRLPDGSQGADHLRSIFYRMGFNDQEIVALSGAHALGRCHPDRSGFEGPWTFSPTTVTNDYFKLLFDEKWVWKKWNGPKQFVDKKTGSLMMLPTDYVLTQDKSFRKYAKAYAEDQDLWFKDFSKAFSRLLELGVPESQWATSEPWIMKTLEEQQAESKQ